MTPPGKKLYSLPEDICAQLRAPLPPEAISTRAGGKGLSSIKPIYIAERLNEVFGMGGWEFQVRSHKTYTAEDTGTAGKTTASGKTKTPEQIDHVVVEGYLVVYVRQFDLASTTDKFTYYTVGGSTNDDIGDMFKGAISDAISKAAAQYLEIGMDVYKGKVKPGAAMPRPTYAPTTPVPTPATVSMQCPKCALEGTTTGMRYVPSGVSKKTGEVYTAFYSCPTCSFITRP